MANPVVSATFSAPSYGPGSVATLTVNHTDSDRYPLVATIVITDSAGNTGQGTATAVIDPGGVTVTSVPAKTWTLVSATQNQSVFTTTV
jgi:threonine dehydratase